MYAVVSRYDEAAGTGGPAGAGAGRLQRAQGEIRLSFAADGGRTRLDEAFQRGSSKVRFPRIYDDADPEAVLLNTAGGITGGDRFSVSVRIAPGAAATLTTQAAEKAYRSSGGEGWFDAALDVGEGGRLHWLPQETILFDGCRLERRLDVSVGPDAEAVLCEAVVTGRLASGETVTRGRLADRWRVRRCGRLVYADDLRLDGDIAAAVSGAATLAGGRAFASLLLVAPDAEERIEAARDQLQDCGVAAGASAWDGMLGARLVAPDGLALRSALTKLLAALSIRVPRAWSI